MSRKKQIVEAGIKLFDQNGYHNTTVSDIVAEVGVAQGTFYLYFKSKKALFIHLLEQFFSHVVLAVSDVRINPDDIKTPEIFTARIRQAVHEILTVYKDHPALARVCLTEAPCADQEFSEMWQTMVETLATLGAEILDRAIEENLLPPQNSKIVAFCVIGMHERIAHYWLSSKDEFDFDELVTTLTRFEMLGLAGIPGSQMKQALEDNLSPEESIT